MCINFKKVLHRSNHFDPVSNPVWVNVPCGHCEECNNSYRNDWFVRCYYEYLQHPKCTYYYTLTFNPLHLPRMVNFNVFSVRLVQLFLKRLRKCLAELGITLKYIITSEYGESVNRRPHHHALFFLSQYLNPFKFYDLVAKCWSVYDKHTKTFDSLGFIKYGDNFGVVNSSAGIQYVTKYVVKDFSALNEFEVPIKKYLYSRYVTLWYWLKDRYNLDILPFPFVSYQDDKGNILHKPLPSYILDSFDEVSQKYLRAIINKYRSKLRSALPFHLQSTKLGIGCIPYIDTNEWKLPVMKESGFQLMALPRYIQRKLWFDVIPSEKDGKLTRFVLNEKGIQHKLDTLELRIENEELRLKDTLSTALTSDFLTGEILTSVNQNSHSTFEDVASLRYFLQHFDMNFRELAIYSIVFRFRVQTLSFSSLDELFDDYKSIFEYHLRFFSCVDYGKIYKYDRQLIEKLDSCTFDKNGLLKSFEFALCVLEALLLPARVMRSRYKEHRERDVRYIRSLYNKT